jgi:cytochrome c oxidase accessory protein FixG
MTVLVIMVTTYAAGGIAREQICTHVCPYARFQGVMYEHDTLAPSYDERRGEGTAGRTIPKKGLQSQEERKALGHGDCIDCGFCVQVCPTGVDIRNGLQYQCISCGLCIDACNTIMDSLGWERGLIRYDSYRNLHSDTPAKPRIVWKQMKVILNGLTLVIMIGLLGYRIATRSNVEVIVEQERQPLYVHLSDDRIRNRYKVHIVNKTEHEESFTISVQGIPQSALNMGAEPNPVTIRPGKDLRLSVKIDLDEDLSERTREFKFLISAKSAHEEKIIREVNFNSEHQDHEHH